MVLVDTSVWVEHLRGGAPDLDALLEVGDVLAHPWVLGELALGGLDPTGPAGRELRHLPAATVADDGEVLALVVRAGLAGRGVGYVDAALVASVRLSRARLLTRDRRLHAVAVELGVAAT